MPFIKEHLMFATSTLLLLGLLGFSSLMQNASGGTVAPQLASTPTAQTQAAGGWSMTPAKAAANAPASPTTAAPLPSPSIIRHHEWSEGGDE